MADVLTWLLGIYNIPFLVPLGIALGLVFLELLTGGLSELISFEFDFGDAEIDIDVDADGDFGIPQGLGWLGFGKAPISVLIEVLFASFGTTGLIVSAMGNDILGTAGSWMALLFALPIAVGVSVLTTHLVGTFIHQYIPNSATTTRRPGFYVGNTGRTMGLVNERVGQVQVSNEGDAPVLLNAYATTLLASGTTVVLESYDSAKKRYMITPVSLYAKNSN